MFNLYSAIGSGTLVEYMNINYFQYPRFIGSKVLQTTPNPVSKIPRFILKSVTRLRVSLKLYKFTTR